MIDLDASARSGTQSTGHHLDREPPRRTETAAPLGIEAVARPFGCHADGSRKYLHSRLLASSAGKGWSTIAAELRSHNASESAPVIADYAEVCLAIEGNEESVLRRTAVGLCQQAVPGTGTAWLSPLGFDEVVVFTAPIPQVLHLYLPWTLFDRLSKDFNIPPSQARSIQHIAGVRDEVIAHLGASILLELTNESSTSAVFVEAAALALAARLLQMYCDDDPSETVDADSHGLDPIRLRRVLDYIEANVQDDISRGALAEIAGYSPYHFARKFTLAMGVPPYRYIAKRRLDWAMEELATGKLPLAEIALNAQFSSQASFTRAFRRATGMTPGAYQRSRAHLQKVAA